MSGVLTFPKPTRLKSPAYLAWIKAHPCLLHPSLMADPHHTKHVSAGGSDFRTLPLCRKCHDEVHRTGRETFQKKHKIDFRDEIIRHLEMYLSAQRGEE